MVERVERGVWPEPVTVEAIAATVKRGLEAGEFRGKSCVIALSPAALARVDIRQVFAGPLHPYTAALLRSAPEEGRPAPEGIPGVVPPPQALPPGCVFAPRCPRRVGRCEAAHPPLMPEPTTIAS